MKQPSPPLVEQELVQSLLKAEEFLDMARMKLGIAEYILKENMNAASMQSRVQLFKPSISAALTRLEDQLFLL